MATARQEREQKQAARMASPRTLCVYKGRNVTREGTPVRIDHTFQFDCGDGGGNRTYRTGDFIELNEADRKHLGERCGYIFEVEG